MLQKGRYLHFDCPTCNHPVEFSIFDLDDTAAIRCEGCQKKYLFSDPTLKRQLKKFQALCLQLIESEEILGDTFVGIDVGEKHVKVPFKILLTRLNPTIELTIGNQILPIRFRIEPIKDLKEPRS